MESAVHLHLPHAVMRNALSSLLFLTLSCSALAAAEHDDVPIYEGAWTMRMDGQRVARLVVKDWEGTWVETGPQHRGVAKACRGKAFPVSVHHSNPGEFEFTAWGSSISSTCPDLSFSVKPVDDKTLEGTTSAGLKVTMTRASRK